METNQSEMEENLLNMCRICAIRSNYIQYKSVFELNIHNNIVATEAFLILTGLEISCEDSYPKVICSHCEVRLKDAFYLRLQAISTASLLVQLKNISKLTEPIEKIGSPNRIEELGTCDNSNTNGQPEHVTLPEKKSFSEQITEDNRNVSVELSMKLKADNANEGIRDAEPIEAGTNVSTKQFNSMEKEEMLEIIGLRKNNDPIPVGHTSMVKRSNRRILKDRNRNLGKLKQNQKNVNNSENYSKSREMKRKLRSADGTIIFQETVNDFGKTLNTTNEVTETIEKTIDELKLEAYNRRKHKCEVCGKRFKGKSNLVDHLRFHANVKPYKCTYCHRSFVQSGSLTCHLRTHTREKPYICSLCNKAFSQPSGLKVHIRTHTNERKYSCDICLKAFVSKGDLTKHQRIHDKVKKFSCEVCSKGFAQKCNLDKHIISVHLKGTSGVSEPVMKIEND